MDASNARVKLFIYGRRPLTSRADTQKYCAIYDKSMKLLTHVLNTITFLIRHGSIFNLTFGDLGDLERAMSLNDDEIRILVS